MLTDPHELRAVLDDVATEARAVVVPDEGMGGDRLPVLVFEPLRAVGIRDGAGHTAEAQAEGIIATGFARLRNDVRPMSSQLNAISSDSEGDSTSGSPRAALWALTGR